MTPSDSLTHYSGEGSGQGFEFDYPSAWNVIGGYHEVARHLRTLMVAVGIGDFDLACIGSFPGSISCDDYKWTVPDDGVVLVYRMEDWPQGPIEPYPSPKIEPGDKWVEIDGRSALFSQDDGILRWDMLGTPEVIEARFGSGVAESAPQEIQAAIDSWHWLEPTATPRPSPIVTGSGSATYEWQKVGGAQGRVFPRWAPDSNHLLVSLQAANEFDQFQLLDRAGTSVANVSALADMFWLNSDVVEGYDANSVPSYDQRGQYHSVPGRALSVSDPTPQLVSLPCCDPISNGHGAVVVTRYLPEQVQYLSRPAFVVWQDGVQSAEHDGLPIGWDLAGDKLLVIHPSEPNPRENDGWLEVLSWPGLTSIFQDDPNNVVAEADFDPTGRYASYRYVSPDAANVWHMEVHVIDLSTGSIAKIPLAGDSSKVGGGYLWDDQGHILAISEGDLTLYTDLPDGTQISKASISPSTSLQSSANGATILSSKDKNDSPANLKVFRDGVWRLVTVPLDNVSQLILSPDGSQLFVNGYSASDEGDAGYLADIPSP